MKRIITALLAGCLIAAMIVVPASAVDAHWADCFLRWTTGTTVPIIEDEQPEEAALPAPTGITAKYTHATTYGIGSNSLRASWDAVDGAASYEVEITKADGTSHIYTTDAPLLWINAGDDDFITGCPHIYNADTHKWEPATARVRALAGDTTSEWSDATSIPCNVIHGLSAEVHN